MHRGDVILVSQLAGGARLTAAAKAAGISERTASRRWADPTFRQEVDEARAELIRQAVGQLTLLAPEAITMLRRLLSAESEQVQLGAARSLLELGIRLRQDEELTTRVAALERALR